MGDSAHKSQSEGVESFVGRTIAGKFLVSSYVGGGAMGAVYRAKQLALDKDVAIKLLHREHVGDPTYVARFQREARAASKLDHPNSMRVIDFGQEPDGLLYIAMEFLDGRDLFRVLRQDWPLPAARVADIASQALAAIAVAHDMGIVHRDLKPENIMVLRGTDDEGSPRDVVKVCDFGIAKFMAFRDGRGAPGAHDATPGAGGAERQLVTMQGFVVGTPEYMSPEQGKGELLDARSDIYAMGVILYHLLTGRIPFDAETALGVVLRHVTEPPTPPRAINPLADERLEAICLKAMEKRREDRYQSAREMRAELRPIFGGAEGGTSSRGTPPAAVVATPATLAIALAQTVAAPRPASSAETPGATAALAGIDSSPSRGRAVATVAVVALLVGGGIGVWSLRARTAKHPPGAHPAAVVAAAPPTTLEPLAVPGPSDLPQDLPPLEAAPRASPKSPSSAAVPGRTPVASASAAQPLPSVPAAPGPSATPAPSSSAAPLDATNARVDWSVSAVGGGATTAAVAQALGRVSAIYTQCYRGALQRRNERLEGQAVMRLVTDDRGTVTSARVTGLDAMPHVRQCISTASHVRIDGISEGDAWAEVQLVFRVD
jgi:serine/threonine-protein kinase